MKQHCPYCDAPGSIEKTDSNANRCRACGSVFRNGVRDDDLDRHALIAYRKKSGRITIRRPSLEVWEQGQLTTALVRDYSERMRAELPPNDSAWKLRRQETAHCIRLLEKTLAAFDLKKPVSIRRQEREDRTLKMVDGMVEEMRAGPNTDLKKIMEAPQ